MCDRERNSNVNPRHFKGTNSGASTIQHLVAGGAAGTLGAIATSPMEVIKTRFQSSLLDHVRASHGKTKGIFPQLTFCIKDILSKDGLRGFYRGVGPNLMGVFPSRAIYFCTYSRTKDGLNSVFTKDSSVVHIFSAVAAGFVNSSITNPIWLIKTKLQLNEGNAIADIVSNVYKERGFFGFYKGISASYLGITETVILFLIYENLKRTLNYKFATEKEGWRSHFTISMIAAGMSKTVATTLAYPHEVIRTRLREQGSTYTSVSQTFKLLTAKHGWRGLYRGLGVHLFRQIPNTAITLSAYELFLHSLSFQPRIHTNSI